MTDIPFWEQAFGSHSRIAALVGGLCEDHEVGVLYLGPHSRGPGGTLPGNAGITMFAVDPARVADHADVARARQRWPWFEPVRADWLAAVEHVCAAWRPEAVILEYVHLGYLVEGVPEGVLRILDSLDVMSHRMAVFAAAGCESSIRLGARDEAEALSRFDAVLAISQFDLGYMRDVLRVRKVLYAPHAIPAAPSPHALGTGREILFIAGMSDANVAGLRAFLCHAWPVLQRDFTLTVIGNIGEMPAVRNAPSVRVLGHVPDLAAEYARADLAVNPVFLGGGLKIKTLEAMAAGLPCVTTGEGARGLDAAVPGGLCVADGWIGYIEQLLALGEDGALRRAVGEHARHFVERHFSPQASLRGLRLLLEHM
ncbi:glycosyltransferase family 4 protein [Sphingomonas sp. CJ20]